MGKFLNTVMAVLNAVGTVLLAIIVVGGALLGGSAAWFVLGEMETGLWTRTGGTVGVGFIAGFLSWLIFNMAVLLDLD